MSFDELMEKAYKEMTRHRARQYNRTTRARADLKQRKFDKDGWMRNE